MRKKYAICAKLEHNETRAKSQIVGETLGVHARLQIYQFTSQ